MNRPLQIASPTHPAALASYFIQALLGFGFITDLTTAKSITSLVGVPFAGTWAVLFLFGGLLALGSALVNPRMRSAHWLGACLKFEALACLILFGCISLYHAALLMQFGPGGVVTTQLLCVAFEIGGLGRAIQIWRERRRIRASLTHPQPANPPPLADSEG